MNERREETHFIQSVELVCIGIGLIGHNRTGGISTSVLLISFHPNPRQFNFPILGNAGTEEGNKQGGLGVGLTKLCPEYVKFSLPGPFDMLRSLAERLDLG